MDNRKPDSLASLLLSTVPSHPVKLYHDLQAEFVLPPFCVLEDTIVHREQKAFVTGNANKLKEVKAILSKGSHPIEIDSQELDSM